jgi:hypothetical protein
MNTNIDYSFKCRNEDTESIFKSTNRTDRDISTNLDDLTLNISNIAVKYHFMDDLLYDYACIKHRQGTLDGKQAVVLKDTIPNYPNADFVYQNIKVNIIGIQINSDGSLAYLCEINLNVSEFFKVEDVNYTTHLEAGKLCSSSR